MGNSKRCSGCTNDLPLDAFCRDAHSADGRQRTCRLCERAYRLRNAERLKARSKAYYEANKSDYRAREREWRAKNPERCRESANRHNNSEARAAWLDKNRDALAASYREWRLANPEKIAANRRRERKLDDPAARAAFLGKTREKSQESRLRQKQEAPDKYRADQRRYKKEYRKRHPDRVRAAEKRRGVKRRAKEAYKAKMSEYHRAYMKANPEKRRVAWLNRDAARRKNGGRFTVADVRAMMERQNGLCTYCTADLRSAYHIDHVLPLTRGGTNGPENLQLTCPTCNLSKNNKTHEEYLAWRAQYCAKVA